MRGSSSDTVLAIFALAAALLAPTAILATPPQTPISVDLTIPRAPGLFERIPLTIRVETIADAPRTEVELVLPPNALAEQTRWVLDLEAGVPVELATSWLITGGRGNVSLSARARSVIGPDSVWGDMKTLPLHVGATHSERGWRATRVPVADLAEPGDAPPLSFLPTPFLRPHTPDLGSPGTPRETPGEQPSVAPSATSSTQRISTKAAGDVTLTGTWQVHDRSGVARGIDQQVVEIRRGDGSALSPRVYCFTGATGSFSCTFPHPGSTMRVWVRSWTNFSPGPTRLGVFEGIEVSGGCGSDSIDCSYPVQTGELTCASGSTCGIGTWTVSTGTGEPWLGAHQMEQDLIRSWKRLYYDTVHPAGSNNPGPARITYPVPSGHGTHAHVNGRDSWISIEPPNQQSGDIVTHEYGHAVMSNLWASYSPRWPTSDCPSPHYISQTSGRGCALSEGFADYWAWYSNQYYDGDGSTSNDGAIFNWPSGASTNLETRGGGSYASGDQVEGNVAAAMGDFYDTANDGPGTGATDSLSDGIQHIWHTTYSQSENNFAEWWSAYWATFGHDGCTAKDVLHYNTINYSTPTCGGGGSQSCSATADCTGAGGGQVSCTGTTGDCYAIDGCYAYCDGQYNLCPSPGPCPF